LRCVALRCVALRCVALRWTSFCLQIESTKTGNFRKLQMKGKFLILLFPLLEDEGSVYSAESGLDVRKSISGYSLEFINGVMSIMSAVIIVSYLLYTLDPAVQARYGSKNVYATTFFVILGLLRYMQITFVEKKSGSPTDIVYKDRFLQILILAWIVSFLFFAY